MLLLMMRMMLLMQRKLKKTMPSSALMRFAPSWKLKKVNLITEQKEITELSNSPSNSKAQIGVPEQDPPNMIMSGLPALGNPSQNAFAQEASKTFMNMINSLNPRQMSCLQSSKPVSVAQQATGTPPTVDLINSGISTNVMIPAQMIPLAKDAGTEY